MSKRIHTIVPCLWFDDQAEAAANFYVGIFQGRSNQMDDTSVVVNN